MDDSTTESNDDKPPPKRPLQMVKVFCDGMHVCVPEWGTYTSKPIAIAEAKRLSNGRYRAKASKYGDVWHIYMSLDGQGEKKSM